LRNKIGVKKGNLSQEIQDAINNKNLPTHISTVIDDIRTIGNFSAHPLKDTNTGEIIEVEAYEAEWTLEILELLFDFCYVQPAKSAKIRDELNKKRESAGK
jgi:hypothetical protein